MNGITRWVTIGLIACTAVVGIALCVINPGATAADGLTQALLATAAAGNNSSAKPTDIALFADAAASDELLQDSASRIWYGNVKTVTIKGTFKKASPDAEAVIGLFERGRSSTTHAEEVNGDNAWQVDFPVEEERFYDLVACPAAKKSSPIMGAESYEKAPHSDVTSTSVQIDISRTRPRVVDVDTSSLTFTKESGSLRVIFSTDKLMMDPPKGETKQLGTFTIVNKVDGSEGEQPLTPAFDRRSQAATLTIADMKAGVYELTVEGVVDWYGNALLGNDATGEKHVERIFKPVGGEEITVRKGITGPTGPYIAFPEYTEPRDVPDGFNPSDHVETRVARLYYYRDAHRVVQIINRTARSYNRAGVDMQRQLADKARTLADQATDARQEAERAAIQAAQRTRQAEYELNAAQQLLTETLTDIRRLETAGPDENEDEAEPNGDLQNRRKVAASVSARVGALRAEVQRLRDEEVRLNGMVQEAEAREKRGREEQFRRDVAAAREDPDTYAPGRPKSDDPVEQVSVSVIGEGLIQLRGPIKGINIIRRMINQIDAPVGQVRVSVHTVQINGEHGDRMEDVAGNVQRYIDHSRFLTTRSSEMLRAAIVQVAAEHASGARGLYPGSTQDDRDRRYLYAFFGKDFIDELAAMDSEFLQTGNKLLSLHSMDTTSLSSALFLLALANSNIRQEILQRFEGMVCGELPRAEQSYYESGLFCDTKCESRLPWRQTKFCFLAPNAKFESLRGFFDREPTYDPNTMTPIQREFIRLAQIFKARLITEMEYKQRVMERSVIEERLGNRQDELVKARQTEADAKQAQKDAQTTVKGVQTGVIASIFELLAEFAKVMKAGESVTRYESETVFDGKKFDGEKQAKARRDAAGSGRASRSDGQVQTIIDYLVEDYRGFTNRGVKSPDEKILNTVWVLYDIANYPGKQIEFMIEPSDHQLQIVTKGEGIANTARGESLLQEIVAENIARQMALHDALARFRYSDPYRDTWARAVQLADELRPYRSTLVDASEKATGNAPIAYEKLEELLELADLQGRLEKHVQELYQAFRREGEELIANLMEATQHQAQGQFQTTITELSGTDADVVRAFRRWIGLRDNLRKVAVDPELAKKLETNAATIDEQFRGLLSANVSLVFANERAKSARRPLDHKKFLDMLVDDLEEKLIELLEGTRAHTANVDNYIKRLATALEDDFNTQFYYPAFRGARESSRYWDVNFAQLETESILANNRAFAKVSPQATMEFDLPKRDILIQEAMNGAKAMVDDFGALVNDPSFLALAQLGSGQPTSSLGAGAGGRFGTVRNVLPGMDSDTAEQIISQAGPGREKLGAALEALIPDPAVYKFETGTGFEIRPVIQPDGQAVVFGFNYMYTTNVREPVRADEKHLGRIKRHFIDTDVQLSNYELREVSRYQVALKASRTSRGVPLLEDVPVAGVLFRPLPQQESSLQQNLILAQAVIYPTLFDLMGLRWAPAVADLDPLRMSNEEFVARNRRRALMNRVYDHASSQVDGFLRIPEADRRPDLYRTQESIPALHPNGYQGPGLDYRDSTLQEGYQPERMRPQDRFIPGESKEGAVLLRPGAGMPEETIIETYPADPESRIRMLPAPLPEVK